MIEAASEKPESDTFLERAATGFKSITGRAITSILVGLVAIIGLYLTQLEEYLLFHTLVEMFTIAVAGGLFMLAWNSRRYMENHYLLWIGLSYLFISFLDLIHTLAYSGMRVIGISGANVATQLWIAARLIQSLALLAAPFFIKKKLHSGMVASGYILTVTLVLMSIFQWKIFPSCYNDALDVLTPFKIGSEYAIVAILLASLLLLVRRRAHFAPDVLHLVAASILVTMVSELSFTLYTDPYGVMNLTGHYLKLAAFYLIYKATVETGLTRPYDLLFHELKDLNETLEQRVADGTAVAEERAEQLRSMAAELTMAEQRERRRLAEVLHDHFQQLLAAAKLQVNVARGALADDRVREVLAQVSDLMDQVIQASRTLAVEVSPPVLQYGDFSGALHWLGQQMKEKHGLLVTLQTGEGVEPVSQEVRTLLFQIVRELLFNVVKHAGADRAWVRLAAHGENEIEVTVEDRGAGFDPEALAVKDDAASFGLFSARGRIELMGGKLDIYSSPGAGSRFTIVIPRAESRRVEVGA